jgi:tRNA-intron endonuclease
MPKKKTAKKKVTKKKAVKKPAKKKAVKKKTVKTRRTSNKFKTIFTGETVSSNTKEAMSLHSQSRFGEKKSGKIIYSIFEALFLLEKGKIEVMHKKKKLKFDKLLAEAREKDKNIKTKYIVFKNMRNRGFIIKTALKFGADFRVYDRGVKPGQDHARWILYPVSETSSLTWHDFSAKNRVAHSTKKNLLIGIVDEEEDVTYYEVRWIKP